MTGKIFSIKKYQNIFSYQTGRPRLPGHFDCCRFEPHQGHLGSQRFHLQSQNLQGGFLEMMMMMMTMYLQVIDVLSRLAGLWVSPNKDVLYSQV